MGGRGRRRLLGVAMTVAVVLGACSGGDEPREVATEPVDGSVASTDAPITSSTSSIVAPSTPSAATPASDGTVPSTTAPTPPPTTVPRETQTVVAVDPDTGEETEVEVDPGAPTTYEAVVDAGVEAGIWTEIDGVRRVLDYVVGATPSTEVPGVESVRSTELTALLERARQLNAGGEYDADELEPIRRRYELFAPPPVALDAIAAAVGPAVQGFRGPAAAPECAPIDVDEFDARAWITGCYTVIQTTLPDATLRVFYPDWYLDDPNLVWIGEVALDALVHSVETFRTLGAVGDIDVVFSAVDTIENTAPGGGIAINASAWGVKPWDHDVVDRCAVTTFLAAADDVAAFEQTIAHEAWHCIQFYDGMNYQGGSQRWWAEGGAEFFSNVAYPSTDDEQRWLDTFDSGLATPIYEMGYEAFPWWQHLSNEFSATFVADVHRELMSTAGPGIELFEGYEEVFHDFVADFVAGALVDQSGRAIPRARYFDFLQRVAKDDEGRELKRTIAAWSPNRWYVSYDKQLRVMQTDQTTEGLRSMVEFEQRADRSSWQGVHPEIRSKCQERSRYMIALTSAAITGGSSTFEGGITIDDIEEASCDPCVLGTWSLDLDTFQSMITAGMEAQGGLPPGMTLELGGAYYVAFEEFDVVKEQRDKLRIFASLSGVGGFTTTIESFATGTYSADGERMTMTNLVESHNKVTSDLPGSGAQSFPVTLASGAGTYECGRDTLELTVTGFDTVTFTRVDKILTPPDAGSDPSDSTPDS